MSDLDAVYLERDHLVAFLNRLYPSHLSPATDAEPGWSSVVCIHSPAGQLTWHVPDRELPVLFPHLVMGDNHWDGHSTMEKHCRLDSLCHRRIDE